MGYERRPDRRGGGGRRGGFGRPDRPPRERPDRDRPPRERADRDFAPRDRPRGFGPRAGDDGGMSIRLDPRRLAALKMLAAEQGVRPGELVTQWVQERLDAARTGKEVAGPAGGALAELEARVDELARRVDELAARPGVAEPAATGAEPQAAPAEAPKRRGRPPKQRAMADAASAGAETDGRGPRVPLHEEIAAIIAERGPMSAADLANAIRERGRYAPPRSAKPLDAATVNARVSNPVYRSRFVRSDGRIGLAGQE